MDILTSYLVNREMAGNISKQHSPLLLMYHGVTPGGRRPRSKYSISAYAFAQQLDYLQAHNYNTSCVRDLDDIGALPSKTVMLTFDDGYENNFESAFRPLVQRGMKATWFVVSSFIGGHASWQEKDTAESRLMNAEQLAEMVDSGMEIGSHTRTHSDLTKLTNTELEKEITGSREDLQELLGAEISSFAYPYGRYSQDAVRCTRNAGYRFACTVQPGWYRSDEDPLQIRRVTVFSDDTLGVFARKLLFADNRMTFSNLLWYSTSRLGQIVWRQFTRDEEKIQ